MSSQPTKKRRTASGSKATATPEAGPATEGGAFVPVVGGFGVRALLCLGKKEGEEKHVSGERERELD